MVSFFVAFIEQENGITYRIFFMHKTYSIGFATTASFLKMQSSTKNSHSDYASNHEKISHRTKTTKNNSFPKVDTTWHDYELALDGPRRTTPTADKYRLKAACISNVTPSRTDEKM